MDSRALMDALNPPRKVNSDRTYRVSVECDETRQKLSLTIRETVGIPSEEIRSKLRESFETLLNRMNMGTS